MMHLTMFLVCLFSGRYEYKLHSWGALFLRSLTANRIEMVQTNNTQNFQQKNKQANHIDWLVCL